MKKLLSILLCASMLSSCAAIQAQEPDGITVLYDGTEIEFDVAPEMINDRVMVPMRTIFETFGAKIKWDGDTKTVTAKRKSKTIEMTIDSVDMTKNGEVYTFDTAPVIKDGRTLIPVRALSEMLELDVTWDEKTQSVVITTPTDDEDEAWKDNLQTIDLSQFTITGGGNIDGNVITITDGGDYTVIGECSDGQIVVDSKEKVKLRLAGMSLTNPSGSAIYFKDADKAYITIENNTKNYLSDGDVYAADNKQKGTVTAKDNLEIKGKGTLTIDAKYNNGIHAANSLEIENGTININSENDGIHVNETFKMTGGEVTVNAKGDGISSEEIIDIIDGTINITTTGAVASGNNERFGRMPEFAQFVMEVPETESEEETEDVSSKGIKAGWMLDISGGKITLNTTDHAIHSASDINIKGGKIDITSGNKGISAHGNVVIDDGDINIPKSTEGIETKQIMTINGGKFYIISSDDGLNAGGGDSFFGGRGGGRDFGGMNGEFGDMPDMRDMNGKGMRQNRQQGGDFIPDMQDIPQDMQNMRPGRGGMNGGDIPDMRPDRGMGMNGDDMPMHGMGGGMMMGGNSTEISTEHHIQINGGEFYICANNDGIDANGSLVIEGGKIIIEGRSMLGGGEMGLDTDKAMIINGGEVLAAGSSISEANAGQNAAIIYLSESAAAGSKLEIRNDKSETVISMDVTRPLGEVLYSSSKLEDNKEYYVYVDNNLKETFTVTGRVTTAGTAQTGGFGGRGMGFQRG